VKTSAAGIELIKKYESLKLKAYRCPKGKLTIGYGSTTAVTPEMVITEAEAEERLIKDLAVSEAAIKRVITRTLSQGRFDALVSFVFNIGGHAFAGSTVARLINQGAKDQEIINSLKMWNKVTSTNADGTKNVKTLQGLVKRRQDEANLFGQI
jgi:lysozyme